MKLRYRIVSRIIYFIWRPLFGLRVYGRENIPEKGGVIVASNHLTNYDPLIVGTAAWTREAFFFAKEELFIINPFYSWLLKYFNAYKVSRTGIDKTAIRHTEELLKKGLCVIMFPEGTRSLKGILLNSKPGVGFIAARTNVPVIPAYIHGVNSPLILQFLRRVRPLVIFGEPIHSNMFKGKIRERANTISQEIMQNIRTLSENTRISINHG
ncbi:MAG: lysophospholipid acyltransferase family protein [bacterium]|nr:lysophospholipid acyltransferase family protein [bacterium]